MRAETPLAEAAEVDDMGHHIAAHGSAAQEVDGVAVNKRGEAFDDVVLAGNDRDFVGELSSARGKRDAESIKGGEMELRGDLCVSKHLATGGGYGFYRADIGVINRPLHQATAQAVAED